MANLGSITWNSVVWTTGDVITEAKLDNMTANEQAYDSHSTQGLLLDNGKALASKDSGGTAYDLLRLNTSNVTEFTAWDGWLKLPTDNAATYASATTITNPTGIDWTTYIVKGMKLKITQTTDKFFVVVNVTATTLTVTGGTDYTVANAAITAFYFSFVEMPKGYPDWFNYTPTLTGFSANPTDTAYRFKTKGRECTVLHRENTNGTSNATTFTATLPITAATVTNGFWNGATGAGVDNTSNLTNPGRWGIVSAGTTVDFRKDIAGTAWTASGGKRINCVYTYEF